MQLTPRTGNFWSSYYRISDRLITGECSWSLSGVYVVSLGCVCLPQFICISNLQGVLSNKTGMDDIVWRQTRSFLLMPFSPMPTVDICLWSFKVVQFRLTSAFKVALPGTRCFLLLQLPPEPLSFGLSLLPQASLSPLKHPDYLRLITEVLLVFHKMDAPHRRWLNKITLGQAGLYQYPPSCHKLWAPER